MDTAQKLSALRGQLNIAGLDGYIVPRADEFQGEFVPPAAERLKWLTGFTGSAGVAVVLKGKAVVLSDGRYTIQLKQQVDPNLFDVGDSVQLGAGGWLAENASEGAKIGFDPMLFTRAQIEKIETALAGKNITLIPQAGNLVDAVWADRPSPPQGKIEIFPETVSGKTAADKITLIAEEIKASGCDAAILAMPDSVSWLLNVRGNDVVHFPAVLSYAIIHADGRVQWIVSENKNPPAISGVKIIVPEKLSEALAALAGKTVMLDFESAPIGFQTALEEQGAKIVNKKDPCVWPRAAKTQQEQDAIRAVHILDGAALVKFLCWLELAADVAIITELDVEAKLLEFRKQAPEFKEDSFTTIAGFGPNGAIVHYRATEKTSLQLTEGNLLLLDSGGQYGKGGHWGTTDITRTIAIGKPSEEMRERFTTVLKGHIALASAQMPEGATGMQFDEITRAPLKAAGIDYTHGTGHGVGCYLSVHEEAANISPRGKAAIKPGMLLSNEPGYYKEGEYGIRIENLILAKQVPGGKIGFETVSFVPIDLNLVKPELLSEVEKTWLNAYHAEVRRKITPRLEAKTKTWLEHATRSI